MTKILYYATILMVLLTACKHEQEPENPGEGFKAKYIFAGDTYCIHIPADGGEVTVPFQYDDVSFVFACKGDVNPTFYEKDGKRYSVFKFNEKMFSPGDLICGNIDNNITDLYKRLAAMGVTVVDLYKDTKYPVTNFENITLTMQKNCVKIKAAPNGTPEAKQFTLAFDLPITAGLNFQNRILLVTQSGLTHAAN